MTVRPNHHENTLNFAGHRLRLARLAAIATAAALAVAAVVTGTAVAAASQSEPPVPVLDWQACDGGFECATAQVPLDYQNPQGPTIKIAVIMHEAADDAASPPVLFVNTGGPSEQIGPFVAGFPAIPAALQQQFDIVTFDPRGAVSMAAALRPDVVLMDVRMPGMDGIEATRHIVAAGPPTRVLILTTFDLDEYAYEGLRAGASGFLLKDVPPAELLSAIRAVASGDAVVAPSVTRKLLDAFVPHLPRAGSPAGSTPPEVESLTARELQILIEIATGLSNAEIAAKLVLAEATVKTHVGRVLAKLQLRDRVQAVVYAYEHGLVHPGMRP